MGSAIQNRRVVDTECPVCGHCEFTAIYQGLLKCGECNFITAEIASDGDDLKALYGESYFVGDEYADYVGDKTAIQRNLRRWLKIVRRYVSGGSLVEVGSAYGFFLELARVHYEATGYDLSEDAVRYATEVLGVTARSADFLTDKPVKDGSVDAVAMWDVAEHLDAPGKFVERASELLRPGGHLFITTGDIEAWLPRRQGPRWRLIHPPTHLQYFSKETMTRMLEGKGFEVVAVSHPGYWRSVKQILHGLFVFGRQDGPSAAYRVLSKVLPGRLNVYINTFDIMFVVARKRTS